MKDDFIYLYLSKDIIKYFECLQSGSDCALSANAFLVLLLASSRSAWCADCFEIADYNKFTNTDENATYIKNTININDRNYNDALRELVKNNLIYKTKKDVYIINSWVAAHGNAEDIQKHRAYCYKCGIFAPPAFDWREPTTDEETKALEEELNTDAGKQKHACVYVDNFKTFTCFNTIFNNKRISLTEIILLLHFATVSQFVKFPHSPELNNTITRSTRELEKVAEMLQIKKRAVQYAINNLISAHLLHKIEGENGKYIINPFISAKGTKDKVKALQAKLLQDDGEYFGRCACGDIIFDKENIFIHKPTGEIKEVKKI